MKGAGGLALRAQVIERGPGLQEWEQQWGRSGQTPEKAEREAHRN